MKLKSQMRGGLIIVKTFVKGILFWIAVTYTIYKVKLFGNRGDTNDQKTD